MEPAVFINYRGEDSHSYGALLYTELTRRFGDEYVFLDVESIPAGADFVQELLSRVRSARVLLAVIGPRWLTATDLTDPTRRRVDGPDDWIRRELAEAFAAGVRVIPVLVEQVEIPAAADLPADIAALSRCQYRRLRYREPTADLARIVANLTRLDPTLAAAARSRDRPAQPPTSHAGGTSTDSLVREGHLTMPVPQQLPGDVRGFVNRLADLERLDALLSKKAERAGTASVCVIAGTAGVGKTSLAVHWAHRVRSRFPDGQLYINLRGYDPGEPVTPATALERLLEALGIAPGAVPTDLEARASLYRSLLADKRILVVLDNAATVTQARPLLPGTDQCLTLVTSRNRLSGLVARDGAQRITLDVFDEPAAVELLHTTTAGYRVGDNENQVAELARLCARLPLALRIAAERAAARPRVPLDALIDDLRDESSLWDALSSDDDEEADAVRTVFAWSYRALSEPAARLFRLLGLHPTPEFSTHVATAASALPTAQTRYLLDTLVGAHLLEQTGPDRWQFHDLLRAYALDQTHHHDTPEEQQAALHRILAWYLHTAAAVEKHDFGRGIPRLTLEPSGTDIQPPRFSTHRAAVEWFRGERSNLIAAMQSAITAGLDRVAWQLHVLLRETYALQWLFEDWFIGADLALQAARRSEDTTGIALTLISLGMACRQSYRLAEAADHFREAHAIYQQSDDAIGVACTLNLLGIVEVENHNMTQAYQYLEQSVAVYRDNGYGALTGSSLGNLAWAHGRFGQPRQAIEVGQQAKGLLQKGGVLSGVGEIHKLLADAYLALGQVERASKQAEFALAIDLQVNIPAWEGFALLTYGRTQQAAGHIDEALVSYQRSAGILRRLGIRTYEADALDTTGIAYRELGRAEEAVHFHRQAIAISRDLSDTWRTAVALDHLAHALHDSGAHDDARASWRETLPLLSEFEDPKAVALRASIQTNLDE